MPGNGKTEIHIQPDPKKAFARQKGYNLGGRKYYTVPDLSEEQLQYVHMRYSHSPLQEALIDIRVEPLQDFNLEEVLTSFKEFRSDYPTQKNIMQFASEISFGNEISATTQSAQHGVMFSSGDSKQLFQVRRDGFTFNRLYPYTGWESVRDEAKRLWTYYRQITKPSGITRLALRYINRLDFSAPADLVTYFNTFPSIATGLPQAISECFMRVGIPLNDIQAMLYMTQATTPPARREVVSIIFDIDLFRREQVPQSEEEIWQYFEILRMQKNIAFKKSITTTTEEMIS